MCHCAVAQDSVDTLTLLVQCEKKLGVMLEILGKATTGAAPKATAESTFISEPVRPSPRSSHHSPHTTHHKPHATQHLAHSKHYTSRQSPAHSPPPWGGCSLIIAVTSLLQDSLALSPALP